VEDQIDAAKVIEYSFVDKSRIGIFIWSYGLCLKLSFKGTIKNGMLVAPVTN
jgi:dipeptidyl-peptidase-4